MRSGLTPYLAVSDADAAIAFYQAVLGATLREDPLRMDDGRVGHAELVIGTDLVMLSEEFPELGHTAGPGGVSLRVEVPDAEAAMARAVARGALLLRAVAETPGGRGGTMRDPFGIRWMLTEGLTPASDS